MYVIRLYRERIINIERFEFIFVSENRCSKTASILVLRYKFLIPNIFHTLNRPICNLFKITQPHLSEIIQQPSLRERSRVS